MLTSPTPTPQQNDINNNHKTTRVHLIATITTHQRPNKNTTPKNKQDPLPPPAPLEPGRVGGAATKAIRGVVEALKCTQAGGSERGVLDCVVDVHIICVTTKSNQCTIPTQHTQRAPTDSRTHTTQILIWKKKTLTNLQAMWAANNYNYNNNNNTPKKRQPPQ